MHSIFSRRLKHCHLRNAEYCTKNTLCHVRSLHSHKSQNSNRTSYCQFLFDVQVSCHGKRCPVGVTNSISPDSCGEDSYFISKNMCGVADGVGGWNENNVDPSVISRYLMRQSATISARDASLSPINVLKEAYQDTLSSNEVEAGSTTACLVKIKQDVLSATPVLEYVNLGDSGFVIVRNHKIVYRSKFQAYGPAPYQLAKIPPRFKQKGAIESQPEEADTGEIPLEEGDLIIIATDGVWDNFSSDLKELPAFFPPLQAWRHYWHGPIQSFIDTIYLSQDDISSHIVNTAIRHGLKPDDVTVVVAKVTRSQSG